MTPTARKGPPMASGKINLAYTGARVPFCSVGYDTVSAQVQNVYSGDMVAATLSWVVSNDGKTWISGMFPDQNVTTAAGTQTQVSDIVNCQGWPWIALEVNTKAASDKWAVVTVFGKNNTGGV